MKKRIKKKIFKRKYPDIKSIKWPLTVEEMKKKVELREWDFLRNIKSEPLINLGPLENIPHDFFKNFKGPLILFGELNDEKKNQEEKIY